MKGPSLQKTTALSAAIHITFLLLIGITIKQSGRFAMPSPYVVSLVGSEKSGAVETNENKDEFYKEQSGVSALSEKKTAQAVEKRIEDIMRELEAKKKIERIVRARAIVSVGKSAASSTSQKDTAVTSKGQLSGQGAVFDSYYGKITEDIRREWIFPESGKKDLSTEVAIRILRDGTVNILNVEKKSGNTLFDRSALRAITKASPVSPPPDEMEIVVRFLP